MKDIQLTLTLEEVNTLLNALGDQPYNQIHLLMRLVLVKAMYGMDKPTTIVVLIRTV